MKLDSYITSIGTAILAALACQQVASAEKVYSGYVCSEQVHKLTSSIDWTRSLKDAKARAAKEDKLILWIHMVGKIDGAT